MPGDFKTDEFTPEEQAALGEEPAKEEETPLEPELQAEPQTEETPLEPTETEQTEVVTEEPAEDKDPIQKRFDKLTWEKKETERKLDLFKKLGPEGYYQAYPDERPAEQPAREVRQEISPPDAADMGAMIVRHPNGPYDGMTLREVYNVDPVFATQLQTDFLWQQRQQAEVQQTTQARIRQESAAEIEAFADSISQDIFGKPVKEATKDEEAKIDGTIQEVLAWMTKTHRGGGNIADAYFLMNREGLLKGAANKAAEKVIKNLQERKAPASIDTSRGGDVQDTGFEAFDKMTDEQLMTKIERMSDKDMAKFFREAPQKLRDKHKSLPWG